MDRTTLREIERGRRADRELSLGSRDRDGHHVLFDHLAVSPTAAVYCATKFAVRAISDGLRQERRDLRVTCIHPGVVESELAGTITNPEAADLMKGYRSIALRPDAIGRTVRYALEQPEDVDVNEIVVRPTRAAT